MLGKMMPPGECSIKIIQTDRKNAAFASHIASILKVQKVANLCDQP